jgi:dipeptidyl aminopeptidase/acylaminoacyl peptidase
MRSNITGSEAPILRLEKHLVNQFNFGEWTMKTILRLFGLIASCLPVIGALAQNRGFTVDDDISMIRFNDPSELTAHSVAKFSPDGANFAVVTSKGILATDQIESMLSLFSSNDNERYLSVSDSVHAPLPRISIKKRAVLTSEQFDSYGSIITELRWSTDSRFLYFLVQNEHGVRRLFRLDVNSHKATPLTPDDLDIVRFDVAKGVVVCNGWRVDKTSDVGKNEVNSDSRVVTGQSIQEILFPGSQPFPTARELWVVRNHHGEPVATQVPVSPQRDISWLPEAFTLSPSGGMLIELQPMHSIPAGWNSYEPHDGYEWLRIRKDEPRFLAADSVWRLKQYSIVNLKDGTSQPLIDGPHDYALLYSQASSVLWSADERRAIVTNTFLPVTGIDEDERKRRNRPCAVADVQLPSHMSHCIVFLSDLSASGEGSVVEGSIAFGRTTNDVSFMVRHASSNLEKRRYIFASDHWVQAKVETQQPDTQERITANNSRLQVSLKQSLNERPTLWVTNLLTGKSKRLWDPNPQLADLALGEASVYRWEDNTGHDWKGGLVKPIGYAPGKRYPLVIQIYNFNENQFLTDGLFPTAMAARHLASSGIVALQLQRKYPHTFDMNEGNSQVAGIESAIDQLAADGLIDPQNIGLVGFSSTAWYVEYALIRDPTRFKAAIIADGNDVSYMQYHLFGAEAESWRRQYEQIIGSKPIGGDGFKLWLSNAPGFNLDRVSAAVRIEAITPASVLGEWELYSSLRMQQKPVDLVYFPEGQHIHQKPLERLESQQGAVDWFRFWLQGYEDPDPTKQDQYRRWKKLRHFE